jgi:HK97 family phage portal protein
MGLKTFASNIAFLVKNAPFNRDVRSTFSQRVSGSGLFDSLFNTWDNTSNSNIIGDYAMRVATVFTCVQVRKDAIGMLPVNIIKKTGNRKEIAVDHPAFRLLHVRPNPWMTATQFWALVSQFIDLHGEAFAEIKRNSRMQPVQIDLHVYSLVNVSHGPDGNPYYSVNGREVPDYNMLHFKEYSRDGFRGVSKITEHRETVGHAKKLKEYGNRALNAVPPVYLSTPNAVNIRKEGQDSKKDDLIQQTQQYFSEGKIPILGNGLKFEKLGLNAVDSGYLAQNDLSKEDLYGIFKVPPALAQSYKTGVTYNNLEQQNLQFLIYTLSPMLKNIEEEVNEKLFLTREQGAYCMRFDVSALLRTDLKTRTEWQTSLFKIGCLNRDEIRAMEDFNPVANGEVYFIEGNNMMPVEKAIAIDPAAKTTPPIPANQQRKLSEAMKARLKEKFNGHTQELIDELER